MCVFVRVLARVICVGLLKYRLQELVSNGVIALCCWVILLLMWRRRDWSSIPRLLCPWKLNGVMVFLYILFSKLNLTLFLIYNYKLLKLLETRVQWVLFHSRNHWQTLIYWEVDTLYFSLGHFSLAIIPKFKSLYCVFPKVVF